MTTAVEKWNEISDDLLSKSGKRIVQEDPDLSDETMRKLKETEHPKKENRAFFQVTKEDRCPGLALLSICIKANPRACMAEIAARYAEVRKVPFVYTAEALKDFLKKEGGFTVFIRDKHNTVVQAVPWKPVVVGGGGIMPPKKNRGALI